MHASAAKWLRSSRLNCREQGNALIEAIFPSSVWMVGNPSVTRPNSQRRVRCGLPVIQELCAFRLYIMPLRHMTNVC
ncbi:MAG: hypothetical protein JWQ49_1322 [Edaphobacter sp.]|nr:hypothetical protein [Edaphobacter sp.]